MLTMRNMLDEVEARTFRKRSVEGMDTAAVAGRPHGKNVYGYRRIYNQHNRELISVKIVDAEAEVLREAARRLLAGESARSISRDFNARASTAQDTGRQWHANKVVEVLTRPAYAGIRAFRSDRRESAPGDYPAIWPPIFDAETYAQLIKLREQRKRRRGSHSTNAKYLLTGVAKCAGCVSPMYVMTLTRGSVAASPGRFDPETNSYLAYVCKVCKRARAKYPTEELVTATVNGYLNGTTSLTTARREHLNTDNEPTDDEADLYKQLDDLDAELEEVYADRRAGKLSRQGVINEEQMILPKKDAIKARLAAKAERDEPQRALDQAQEEGITNLEQFPSVERRRKLIQALVDVWVLPARPGPGFDDESVIVRPKGSPKPEDVRAPGSKRGPGSRRWRAEQKLLREANRPTDEGSLSSRA
jgi:hypothetical protein